MKKINLIAINIICSLISFYRYWIAILLPANRCIYTPSCSTYAIEAFKTHGIAMGFFLTISRISKCHPFEKGGFDPVPKNYG